MTGPKNEIELREQLIEKLKAMKVTRKRQIDVLDSKIAQVQTARNDLVAGYHDIQAEMDQYAHEIEQMKAKV